MGEASLDQLIEELIGCQQKALLECGRRLIPQLTGDDVLQPNDFPELEFNPHFRYEEGVLAGMLTVKAALKARSAEADGLHPLQDV